MRTNNKVFIKFLVLLFVVTSIALVAPSQTYAAWWNPFSWFSKDKQVEEQKPQTEEAKNNSSTTTNTEIKEEQKKAATITAPQNNSSDAKTIEDLKAEVATLKTNLDRLYKAHADLVNDHNALLEYTKSIAVANKGGSTQQIDTSKLEWKITDLKNQIEGGGGIIGLNTRVTNLEYKGVSNTEETLKSICAWTFGSSILTGCPFSNPNVMGSIDSRLKALERGY